MIDILDLTYEELEGEIVKLSYPKFRAKQIWDGIYKQHVYSFEDIKVIPAELKDTLSQKFILDPFEEIVRQKSSDGTQKALLELSDGERVETVLMKYRHGYSVCVSTQIGCRIGCSFCASHLGGFKRNLSAGEIVAQVNYWARILSETDDRVSNIVVMGIGEPLDNLDSTLKFIDIVNDPDGLGIGARKITVSTSGIVDKFEQFANYDKQVNLAISLHASNNDTRTKIMRINRKYSLEDIIDGVRKYQLKNNRQVTFEYIMLKDVNDSVEDARALADLIGDLEASVNLIPYNTVEESGYATSKQDSVQKFQKVLSKNGVVVSVRSTKGEDIDGACGQLRYKKGK